MAAASPRFASSAPNRRRRKRREQLEDVPDGEVDRAERLGVLADRHGGLATAIELEAIFEADRPHRREVAQTEPCASAEVMDADRLFLQVRPAAVDEERTAQAEPQREPQLRVGVELEVAPLRAAVGTERSNAVFIEAP